MKDAETCEVKKGRAVELLAGLGKEAVAWDSRSAILDKSMGFLVGNIMLASGFIAYIGPYTAEYRGELIDLWRKKAKEVEIEHRSSPLRRGRSFPIRWWQDAHQAISHRC